MSRRVVSLVMILILCWLWPGPGSIAAQDTAVEAGEHESEPIVLGGFWLDGERVVQVNHSGASVIGMYLEPHTCDHRDGTSSETSLDFDTVLNGDRLTGDLSACYWNTADPSSSGFRLVPLDLTVSDDQNALEGTWFNDVDNQDIPITISRITCRLMVFNGNNFTGSQVVADILFVPLLKRIDAFAGAHSLQVHVTSSLRTSTVVPGAIVDPATSSNHLIGHAIDMNLRYVTENGTSTLCNSACLGGDTLPTAISAFLGDIRSDSDLRWGGDFNTPDVVHIDDGLNLSDPEAWQAIYDEVQADPACFLDE